MSEPMGTETAAEVVPLPQAGAAGAAPVRSRRQRFEPDERRKQILRAAIRVFEEKSYASVSTTELAAAAGVTRGLMHHYFGTKRELYIEVVRVLVTVPEIDEVGSAAGSVEERIDSWIAGFLDFIERHGTLWVSAVSAEGFGGDPDVMRVLDEADDIAASRLIDVVGLNRFESSPDDLRAMIRAYGGVVKAAAREWVLRESLTRDRVHAMLRGALLGIVREALVWDE
ncbi:TetR/AcrR family transcriptional regulator [Hoyosella sp. YIM 151337]|uniref:TetR/AcrR family transcriptional regulator n=1 Tax=Hoyosella sp. YIM 151337 TaxID=2992742 RepID=UPI002236900A|nr:TetR/AcrR family transcriptional regulator [Hoyosella sp. YIM 151337]MCW4354882.1 TetR/AcrR family transcriptional regulator [Hoyosella sp. YIM 151337]